MGDYNFVNLRNNETNENKRLFLAIIVSMLFLTFWNIFTSPSEEELNAKKAEMEKTKVINNQNNNDADKDKKIEKSATLRQKKEIFLKNKNVHIGFDVANNRITFLALTQYKQHEKSVKNVILLDDDHFIESGWIGAYKNSEINWQLASKTDNSLVLTGTKNGIHFQTKYELDDIYGIKIKQSIANKSNKELEISSYSRAFLKDTTDRIENSYAFRGILMMNEGKINEINYDKVQKKDISKISNVKGWLGISDQYWITALVHINDDILKYTARYNKNKNSYQIDISSGQSKTLKNGEKIENEVIAFVAPKKLELLHQFGEKYNVEKIDKVIDFGMFYFLSKPLLIILKRLFSITGNFGFAIILLTILVRMIIFPLANKSYKAMAKMKKLSPKMQQIQEQYKDDKRASQMAIYELYKQEKINPMSAIVPLLFQIPIFFALYKVLVISIEMRDAPFFGWIVDLSSKDPSSIFNLFGLLNFEVPQPLQIGVLPLIMGFTMFLQQKLQPSTAMDPTQQKIIKWMPVIFTIMFASMPAGLVLYWSCSNIFTIMQQTIILKIINKDD